MQFGHQRKTIVVDFMYYIFNKGISSHISLTCLGSKSYEYRKLSFRYWPSSVLEATKRLWSGDSLPVDSYGSADISRVCNWHFLQPTASSFVARTSPPYASPWAHPTVHLSIPISLTFPRPVCLSLSPLPLTHAPQQRSHSGKSCSHDWTWLTQWIRL